MTPDSPNNRPDPYQPTAIPGKEHSPLPGDPRKENKPLPPDKTEGHPIVEPSQEFPHGMPE